jgi:uncharacterized protein (DUF924 family)
VLAFWFGELVPEAWFRKDETVDTAIRDQFLELHEWLARTPLPEVQTVPKAALAAVIALDQFPRNMFRGTARAFATDPLALGIARQAVASRLDAGLRVPERLFLYLPFEHSEDASDQARSVELIGSLGNAEHARYALAHKATIDRFGRFPHRNAILGRPSTLEEIAFLAEPGSSF